MGITTQCRISTIMLTEYSFLKILTLNQRFHFKYDKTQG